MDLPPLTHHDIMRHAAVFSRRDLRVKLEKCDRARRYIQFDGVQGSVPNTSLVYSLNVGKGDVTLVTRTLVHHCGLVSCLTAIVKDVESLLSVLDAIPEERQIKVQPDTILAHSYSLIQKRDADSSTSCLQLRYTWARVAGLELRVDTSASSAMPADVRVLKAGSTIRYASDTLADGTDTPMLHPAAIGLLNDPHSSAGKLPFNQVENPSDSSAINQRTQLEDATVRTIPDDVLAVLGPQWRPLVYQGDHWKGVLRLLGDGETRTRRAEQWIGSATNHLATTITAGPASYHRRHGKARWHVYFRRLRPVMLFIGILALMPISWLLVSEGEVQMHPLALGLTPLLMVGVIVLTAREIPVMEIPPRPGPLAADSWSLSSTTGETTAGYIT